MGHEGDTIDQEADDFSNSSDMIADMGFMFDSEQAVVCKKLSFQYRVNGKTRKVFNVDLESVDDDPGAVQSGHYMWPASPALAQHLVNTYMVQDGSIRNPISVVELGAGCGLGGCIAMQLPGFKTVVFTDHDPGTLNLSRSNAERTATASNCDLHYRLLSWGDKKQARILLSDLGLQQCGFELIIGSDLIYDVGVVMPLFVTISLLLRPSTDNDYMGQRMVMTQSFPYDDATEQAIDDACKINGLLRKVVSCSLAEGGVKIQTFDVIS